MTTIVRKIAMTVAFAVALLWPAFVNGGAFWFPDTSTYIRGADAAVVFATGQRSEWSDRLAVEPPVPDATANPMASSETSMSAVQPTRPVLSGRSIYYGFIIYLPMLAFGPWGAIGLQALIVASVLAFCTTVISRERRLPGWAGGAGAAVLVLATPLPFYTTMLMPDVYSGMLVAIAAVAACLWHRLSGAERVGMALAAGAMASFHTSHILLLIGVAGTALVFHRFIGGWWGAAIVGTSSLVLAVLSSAAFSIAIERSLGQPPISPPFLSARMASGPAGMEYLARRCADEPDTLELCRHLDKLPLHSDSFLWSENPETGVFQHLSGEEQRRMASEDKRLFLSVMATDPLGFAAATSAASLEQLTLFDLANFNHSIMSNDRLPGAFPLPIAEQISVTRTATQSMPTRIPVVLSIGSTLVAVAIMVLAVAKAATVRGALASPLMWFCVLLVAGVLANAVICGALSGPHARYQMRLIWLLPFAATVASALLLHQASIARRPDEKAA